MKTSLRFAENMNHRVLTADLANAILDGKASEDTDEWVRETVKMINRGQLAVNIRLSRLRWPIETSQRLAHLIAEKIKIMLIQEHQASSTLYVEIDRVQRTSVKQGQQVRTLLPHFDGAHCSYLTPSLLDMPSWNSSWRQFSSEAFTTTQTHKMYQGIFILEPGNGLSVTTYYDLLQILQDTWVYQKKYQVDVTAIVEWLGTNIKESLSLQHLHHSKYLSIGAMLGSSHILHHAFAVHYLEGDFTTDEIALFPQLQQFCYRANALHSPVELYLDDVLNATMGLDWESFRNRYEIALPNEQCDFIIGNNLSLLHGGLMGAADRVFEPICLVVDNPQGDKYELWLSQTWRRL
jgi:hypothetical protein